MKEGKKSGKRGRLRIDRNLSSSEELPPAGVILSYILKVVAGGIDSVDRFFANALLSSAVPAGGYLPIFCGRR